MRVLSNVNVECMRRFLEERFPGEPAEFAPYDQVVQEFLSGKPQKLMLVYLEAIELFPDEVCEFQQALELADSRLNEIMAPASAYLQANPESRVLINTLVYPTSSGSLERNLRFRYAMIDAFNLGLSRWKSERLVICDWAATAARLGSTNLYDERAWYLGRIPLSVRGQQELANLYAGYARALSGQTRKVLVVDLDNTIWGGVIGEDGVSGIAVGEDGLGKVYRDFQTQLRRLKDRGFLLAIASKNNEADVDQVFAQHPMMVLTPDDFVARKIGWGIKSEAIAEMSKELSLGLDSFVFIDDSPVERGIVKQALPDVAVPEFPADPFTLNSWFQSVTAEYFDTLLLTDEDRQRTELYQADIRRQHESRQYADIEDFYRSLQMEMRVWIDHREQVGRLAQLTQKTNQFNLTTRRYDVCDIERFMASADTRVYDMELVDRHGSNGITGLIIARIGGKAAEIDTFLLSCRVIGRNIEQAFFAYAVDDLAKMGVREIAAEYVPTPKNAPCAELLDQLGFESGVGQRRFIVRPLNCPDYIEVREATSCHWTIESRMPSLVSST